MGGMPLAFTQEDFLVWNFILRNCWIFRLSAFPILTLRRVVVKAKFCRLRVWNNSIWELSSEGVQYIYMGGIPTCGSDVLRLAGDLSEILFSSHNLGTNIYCVIYFLKKSASKRHLKMSSIGMAVSFTVFLHDRKTPTNIGLRQFGNIRENSIVLYIVRPSSKFSDPSENWIAVANMRIKWLQ